MSSLATLDAPARERDPTGTIGLRRSFRAAGTLRMNQLRAQMRVAVMEHDVLGFAGGALSSQPPDVKLRAFAGWLTASAGQMLGGPWLSWWVAKAWASGEQVGISYTNTPLVSEGSGAVLELARVELDGIVGAVIQQVVREAARSLVMKKAKRQLVWRRLAAAFDKVGPPRIMALANTITVMAHNRGRGAAFKAAGFDQVGIIPESMTSLQRLDAMPRALLHDKRRELSAEEELEAPSRARLQREFEETEVGIVTAGDDRVCEACEDFAADAPHDIDKALDTLPMHVGCRCAIVPWYDKRFRGDTADGRREEETTRATEATATREAESRARGSHGDADSGQHAGHGIGQAERPITQIDDGVDNILHELVQLLIDAWNEADHPRGQPENAGQFGPGGGGESSESSSNTPAARPDIHQRLAKRRAQAEAIVRAELPEVKPGTQRYEAEVVVRSSRIMQAEERAASTAAAAQPTAAGAQKELFPGEFPPVPEKGDKPKPEDFHKAKIELGPALRNLDSERGKKFVEVWENAVKLDPEEFKTTFLGKTNATMQIEHRYNEDDGEVLTNELRIMGNLLNDAGKSIGSYTREIDLLDNSAESAYFAINPGEQGGGIGKELLRSNVALYQQMGLDKVKVHANIDVGGYAWAKYGYVPDENDWDTLRGDLRDKIDEMAGSFGTGGGAATSWEEMNEAQQENAFETWQESGFEEFYDQEVESWRDSGGALVEVQDSAGQ